MKIAVEGCAHGEVEKIYETIEAIEKQQNLKVDLLLCCGDFQATRNHEDLNSMAVPKKYRSLQSFQLYYSGEKVAPILTIIIGGNHEASNYLQELPYGGWLAPNIYYLGYAGVVNVGGLRIAGLSGIYKSGDYHRGRFEAPPYNENTKRSVYHVRNLEVFRFKQMKSPIDIFLSHDWPLGVYNFGNVNKLLKEKQFFEKDIADDRLGSLPGQELLYKLKPKYWFAGHLHVKFAALVPHEDEGGNVTDVTKFLALDKCLPKRKFLQIVDVDHDKDKPISLEYDLEWLTILHYTNHLISTEPSNNFLPGPSDDERWIFTPTEAEKNFILSRMGGDLTVPLNFVPTVQCYQNNQHNLMSTPRKQQHNINQTNVQTEELCQKVGIDDPLVLLLERIEKESGHKVPSYPGTPDEVENNISFVDSELSGFCSGSDENEKSPDEEPMNNSVSPTKLIRSSLNLPAPKFTIDSPTPALKLDSPISDTSPPVEDSNLFFIDDGSKRSHEEVDNTPMKMNIPVGKGIKKFKRRNIDIYRANEE